VPVGTVVAAAATKVRNKEFAGTSVRRSPLRLRGPAAGGNIDGEYAYDARHPYDDNPSHWYQCLVQEKTLDLPETEHRFYCTWHATDTDQDEYLGQTFRSKKRCSGPNSTRHASEHSPRRHLQPLKQLPSAAAAVMWWAAFLTQREKKQ
jgi:hypothetical protein